MIALVKLIHIKMIHIRRTIFRGMQQGAVS